MGKMTVYHGSYTTIAVPEIIKGKNTKDFGPGFYCTVIREQAERWAKRYDTPVVNIPHDYDLVIGAMANDQIYNYIADYIDGIITREQFWSLARFKYPTHQINFCSSESLKCLTFVSGEEVVK